MHFTTLYILKDEELDKINTSFIEDDFCKRFCYCCGETTPMYQYWCDWFQIGGRWCDILKAKKGIHCGRSWSNDNAPIVEGNYSVVDIKDLTEPINRSQVYAVATKSRIYQKNDEWGGSEVDAEKYDQLLDDIDNKRIKGVIALIDCHD